MKQPFNQFTTLLFILFFTIGTGPAIADDPVQFEGLIEPFEMVDVGSPVEGLVAHVNVQRSSSVKKGEPLVLLESSVENAIVEYDIPSIGKTGTVPIVRIVEDNVPLCEALNFY